MPTGLVLSGLWECSRFCSRLLLPLLPLAYNKIIVTPIGATKGLRLFYCMRVAVAAEATWNNIENTPIILIKLDQSAYKERESIGELRYNGFLDANKEEDIISSKNLS